MMSPLLSQLLTVEVIQRHAMDLPGVFIAMAADVADSSGRLHPYFVLTFPVTDFNPHLSGPACAANHRAQRLGECAVELLLQLVKPGGGLAHTAPFAPSIKRFKNVVEETHRTWFIPVWKWLIAKLNTTAGIGPPDLLERAEAAARDARERVLAGEGA